MMDPSDYMILFSKSISLIFFCLHRIAGLSRTAISMAETLVYSTTAETGIKIVTVDMMDPFFMTTVPILMFLMTIFIVMASYKALRYIFWTFCAVGILVIACGLDSIFARYGGWSAVMKSMLDMFAFFARDFAATH
jgi:hypothetical protein